MTSFSLVVHALNKPLIFMVEITALLGWPSFTGIAATGGVVKEDRVPLASGAWAEP